ncbi:MULTISPECIES: SDR family oxidoreductase [Arthrobacter]|uniref:SDR family oxidoreductase n=1 Tax=Arthrobacter terricola TaxID=2547396 RepID=A0A4R5KQ45_9MICC|nr:MULTISPECIES: SDR family oxidoreductase [Arthrobacter]MBT8160688.1 SDR family oxidoreductase [Arthrobacter sp. GN70]TDF97841.1 SDR family oxidoreductase [Arthrobacter terricola]
MTDTQPVLVVGGTGHVGAKVVDELLARGKAVRALVRPGSDAGKLEAKGVEIARGDMLDLGSLIAAMTGADAVITSAAGYTRRDKRALEIDTVGNTNLAIAASNAGIRRFVLVSILTSDQTPDVPHFWHKKLTEDKLQALRVPFVALRPGAFLDQVTQMSGDPFEKKRLTWFGTKTVPLTFVLTSDLAAYLAAAVDADVADGERIDIGWDRPVSMQDVADIASTIAGEKISVRSVPAGFVSTLGTVVGPFVPMVKDMSSMLAWFETGKYVADTTRQAQVFGPVPTAEDAVARFARELGH